MKITKYEPIVGGVFIDEHNKLRFNWTKDKLKRDIVRLKVNTHGQTTKDGVQIIYGYSYNPECDRQILKEFRKQIKHPDPTSDIYDFVEDGVLHINDFVPIDSFEVIVGIKPSYRPSILDVIKSQLLEHVCKKSVSFELIKETYEHVSFDSRKATKSLLDAGYDADEVEDLIQSIVIDFEYLKDSGKLFEMKRFLPREIRAGFFGFLKFATDKERRAYENLQGVNALIYDDLLTSGATISETARYLHSINPTNTLTAFVLIQQ